MPGITGIIRKYAREDSKRDLECMINVMRHRNSYREQKYVNEEYGLYVGCVSGNRTSNAKSVINKTGDVTLIFYGDTYLSDESRKTLTNGNTVDGTDVEYLLTLYEEKGEDFVRLLNGWFCGIIADLRSGKIILFNDRYGMSRLYFYEGNNEVLFGSEAKSLLKARPELRVIDPEALAQFLRCDCVLGNKSLFKDISLLPGGSIWSFDSRAGVLTKRRYFEFKEWEQQDTLEPDDFYERFVFVLDRIIPRYAEGKEKVGVSLTAGLDTRVLVASLHQHGCPFPCYTFGGVWGETFDIRTGRKLARIYNQPYQVIRINEDFLKGFSRFAERSVYLSDGALDAFSAHDIYFNEIAREIAPVRLTGKYGSEIVRVRRMIPFSKFPADVIAPDLRPFLEAVPSPDQVTQAEHPLSRTVSEEIPWFAFGRLAVEQSQLDVRTPYMDNDLVKLMYQAPNGTRAAGDLQEDFIKDKSPEFSALPTNLGRLSGQNRVLTKLRYLPLWTLFKIEYTYLYATPHWLTRIDRFLGPWHLERLLSGRQKFEGYRIWIKTHFASFICETLLNPQAAYTQYFDYGAVSKMVNRHIAGTHNHLDEINKALTIELVCSSLLRY